MTLANEELAVVEFLREHIIGQEHLDCEGNVAPSDSWRRSSLAVAFMKESPAAFALAMRLGPAVRLDGYLRPKLTVVVGGKR